MPLDCGLWMAVVSGVRFKPFANDFVSCATYREPLSLSHSIGLDGNASPKRASIASTIRSRTRSPSMPAVEAAQLIASRSQQSSAKATRTRSALSQPTSKPSEHQRRLLCATAIVPSCARVSIGGPV